jgi:plasmid maintenance system antidote protein VapI
METKNRVGASGILTAPELKMFVAVKLQMAGLDIKGYAAKLKVPHQTVYAILNGRRLPSKEQLDTLGLETVYRIKGTNGIMTAAELKMFVTVKMQMSGLDVLAYAKKLGITHKLVYMMINGARLPSKALLKKLGLETVYRIVAAK